MRNIISNKLRICMAMIVAVGIITCLPATAYAETIQNTNNNETVANAPAANPAAETNAQTANPAAETNIPASNPVVAAGPATVDFFAYIPTSSGNVNISISNYNGRNYLFLPASVSLSKVYFHYTAEGKTLSMFKDGKETPLPGDTPVNITKCLSAAVEDGSKILTIHITDEAGAVAGFDLYVMKSENIASMYVVSGDPSKGRGYVDEKKSNKAEGTMTMLNKSGGVIYSGVLTQIKGRGNTSFGAPKKPYQIKIANACDLIQTGNSANVNKTWVLLANAYDPTLIHNTVGYKMAQAFGLNAPDCRPVDLYYDGEYRGNYLLSEKVEIASGRVDISPLEKDNSNANDGKDLGAHATATATNKYGDKFQYVTGVTNPENITGGYLLEQDNQYYEAERSYFITSTGTPFVVKSPENCSKEEMEYISDFVEEMIRAAANGGVNPDTEKSVWDYIDKQSLVKTVILQETVKNADAFSSSTYYYLDKNYDKLVSGPIWDLDDSYGIRTDMSSVEGFAYAKGYIDLFLALPDFKAAIKSYYNSTGYSKAVNNGIDKYVGEIAASQKMNRVVWNSMPQMFQKLGTYEEDVNYMKTFSRGRADWLKGVFATW